MLGIENSRNVSARLDEDEKGVDKIDTLGGKQNMTIIQQTQESQNHKNHSHTTTTVTTAFARQQLQQHLQQS